ncbi:hypothetical protein protein [Bacillus cereus G9241]|nr:hypothetical protein protein [Bacillus cereus G9241]
MVNISPFHIPCAFVDGIPPGRFIPSSLKVKNAAPPLYKACAPRFIQIPFLLIVIPRPPKRLDLSNTITFLPAFAKYIDAVNPARPPPTIATSNFFIIKSLLIVLHTRRTIKEGCDMKIYFYSSILFHYFFIRSYCIRNNSIANGISSSLFI